MFTSYFPSAKLWNKKNPEKIRSRGGKFSAPTSENRYPKFTTLISLGIFRRRFITLVYLLLSAMLQFRRGYTVVLPLLALCLSACNSFDRPSAEGEKKKETPRFQLLDANETGVNFANTLIENDSINVIFYDYLYNGGGVAAGDLDNDGLPDLYFTGNQAGDKLYLSSGDLKFVDVSNDWGISNHPGWSTGVTFVDINNDGWLDIYVCRSGPSKSAAARTNLLFINQAGKGMVEDAAAYGLDYTGHSTQAVFFDADGDGDLDCYLVTHPGIFTNRLPLRELQQLIAAGKMESDHFFRNENGVFFDDSQAAGINDFAFGLGVAVEDFNGDGALDIYVSNDFDEGDLLYINNGQGQFTNEITSYFKHTANYGMGCDAADFNNDGYIDLMQVDMAFETHERAKRNMAAMDQKRFDIRVQLGWHHQYMFNCLQLNNGDGTFSDVAAAAGVHKTDWSWAALFADFDHDGFQDLFITNGYKRDTKDNDLPLRVQALKANSAAPTVEEVLGVIPATKLKNYMFRNADGMAFERVNAAWGLDQKLNSNGAAYVDLDRDGDLDLVINNVDEPASIYRNMTIEQGRDSSNWIAFRLTAGCRAHVHADGKFWQRYAQTSRGYLSCVDDALHVGLGTVAAIDSVVVIWPNQYTTTYTNLAVNQYHDLNLPAQRRHQPKPAKKHFERVTLASNLHYKHIENAFDDFASEVLLPHKMSTYGPGIAAGDVNNDQLLDVWIGGASGSSGALFIQGKNGQFQRVNQPAFEKNKVCEEVDATFIDVNGDGFLDLYVVSGDASRGETDDALRDRLYLNDGKGNFTDASARIPDLRMAGGCIARGDFDGDGVDELFIGGRNVPGRYPMPAKSVLLKVEGGQLIDASARFFGTQTPEGLFTSAVIADLNGDGNNELITAGEWMDIEIYPNENGKLQAPYPVQPGYKGWWQSLAVADINGDGRLDIVAGNLGENNKFKPSAEHPLFCYAADFDSNGSLDIVLAKYEGETLYPVRGRECSSTQMPFIADKFDSYEAFARSDLSGIYSQELLASAYRLDAENLASQVFYQVADGAYAAEKLPLLAQIAPVRSIVVFDVNKDGKKDLLLAGNHFGVEVETVRYDAGNGVVLRNTGTEWQAVMAHSSGLSLPLDVRKSVLITDDQNRSLIVTAVNGGYVQVHRMTP